MTPTVRALAPEDLRSARTLGWEAFGVPADADRDASFVDRPGRSWFGAFVDETLVATAADRAYEAWFGGRPVPISGIASVTVAAEHRGRGLVGPLLRTTLAAARGRGAAVAMLFPSAPRIYRGLGFEVVTTVGEVRVPTSALVTLPRTDVVLRRATAADAEAIRATYDRWAAQQNGPLTRRGVSFPASGTDLVGGFTGITLALGADDEVRGYASWNRGTGDDTDRALQVADLIALDVEASRALLRAMGSFATMTPTLLLPTSGVDPLRLLLPTRDWERVGEDQCMITLLDVQAAVSGMRCSPALDADLTFTLTGSALADTDGSYRVRSGDGGLHGERAQPTDDRVLEARGLAVLYAGAAPCAELRLLGLLHGGDPAEDLTWDALFRGRGVHVRDSF